jgi:HEAT repeat protein
MDREFNMNLMGKLDRSLTENSDDYLSFDWEGMGKEQVTNFGGGSAASYIDKLISGYYGFKKYKYDRLLFNVLYTIAARGGSDALELLLEYLKDKDRRGFAAEALGRLKEKRAAEIIVEVLNDSLIFRPKLITYIDPYDRITLSSYVFMIEALKNIGDSQPGVLRALEKYSVEVDDEKIRKVAKEALENLKGNA